MRPGVTSLWLATVLYCLGNNAVRAEEDLPVAPEAFVYCTVCHGIQLMGNPIIRAPRLSGMDAWYVEQQLISYKKGIRGAHEGDVLGYEMQPMAAALADEQIARAAEFVSTTRSPAPAATLSGDVGKGKVHYATCAACHGIDGKGNEALGSPDLTIQNDWYLVTQLRNFKSGARGSHPGDSYGMQMRASVQLLADDEAIVDVVSYINTLRDK